MKARDETMRDDFAATGTRKNEDVTMRDRFAGSESDG
jgi:hypothetical protein